MVSQEELLSQVQNGDILLFRTKSLDKKVSLVKQLYDHVAIFIRKSNFDLYLFEAPVPTSHKPTSVTLTSWQYFVKKNYNLLYQKIVYRKLKGPSRSTDFNMRLASFINTAIGLNCVKSPRRGSHSVDSKLGDDIYCAELVAACYRQLGIIDSSVAVSTVDVGSLHVIY